MDFDRITQDIAALNLNLYDFALYTPGDGIFACHMQPCSNCSNSYSVAKLFVVTALGLLWDEGKIRMDDPIGMYFDIPSGADPGWKTATIEHAVTHRLGFGEGFLDIDTEDVTQYPTEDYLSMVFAHPLAFAPGTESTYTDAAYYLLSRLVSKVTGEQLDVFLNRRLLRPLSFHEAAWSRCPQEYPIGATGLYTAAGDMVKLAALYLEGGVWQGKRILSSDWVRMALERGYELHPFGESGLIGKGGMYGQAAVFSAEKRFAAAWHAHEGRENMKRLWAYLDDMKL
ncbi:MAG: beta-lactamase family protein [Clostridia bacterium]|nr:beta-lactamase family protein [Clostridia bacterium]